MRRSHTVIIFVSLCLLGTRPCLAQSKVPAESGRSAVEKTTTGAMLRSALVPGWGQWYNQQKLKAVLVLGVEAGLASGAVIQHQRLVKERNRTEMSPESIEFYRDSRSQFIWYLAGGYLLNILDAFVDAYLWDFDTSEDLSLTPFYQNKVRGITLTYRWTNL